MPGNSAATAAILIIGDEILKGHTPDSNSSFLLAALWHLGIKVYKVCVVPDDVDVIAEHVSQLSKLYSIVFTTGGIGPTHDDVTFASLSKAFGDPLTPNKSMLEVLRKAIEPTEESAAFLKMAMMPSSCNVREGYSSTSDDRVTFPLISINNVYVLPGVPKYMRQSFDIFKSQIHSGTAVFHQCKVYLLANETDIAHVLDRLDAQYKDDVHIGSYPAMHKERYWLKITLESQHKERVESALKDFLSEVDPVLIVDVRHCCSSDADQDLLPVERHVDDLVSASNVSSLSCAFKCAWAIVKEALDHYRLAETCISFNGGKDCTVLLHVWLAAVKQKLGYLPAGLQLLYVKTSESFQEAEDFIATCVAKYHLDVITVSAPIKNGLAAVKRERPGIKACLMGTRRHDPYSSTLRAFTPTDGGWPSFMRINPVLDWSYRDVWLCLRSLGIPYCSLYDQGYTSLGSKTNTTPNPLLLNSDGTYKPAYALEEDHEERLGRQ